MRFALLGLFGGLVLALTGCGGPKESTVSGTVTYDDEPIREGHIAFVPEGAGTGAGGPITDGKYSVRLPPGKYRVEVTASKMMPLPPDQVGMDGKKEEVRQYLPARYNSKTELTADVPGTDPHDFHLKP